MRKNITRIVYRIHGYLGLITGIALLLIGLSGSILVFSPELEKIVYKNIHECVVNGNRITLDSSLVLAKLSFFKMDYVGFDELPQSEEDTYKFFMIKDGVQYKAFIDPYSGKILHSGKRYDHIFDWLLIFHYTFAIPAWGDLTVAILSITLILSLISGVIVYRKHIIGVLLFRVKCDFRNWRKASSGLHRIVGVWSMVFLLMIAMTGLLMMKYAFTEKNFKQKDWKVKSGPVSFSIDEMLLRVKREYPEYHAIECFLPTENDTLTYIAGYIGKPSFVFGDYNDQIIFDGEKLTANFVSDKSGWENFEGLIFPIHSGHYGNVLVKIVYCMGGLVPGLLSITGGILWYRRKVRRKRLIP